MKGKWLRLKCSVISICGFASLNAGSCCCTYSLQGREGRDPWVSGVRHAWPLHTVAPAGPLLLKRATHGHRCAPPSNAPHALRAPHPVAVMEVQPLQHPRAAPRHGCCRPAWCAASASDLALNSWASEASERGQHQECGCDLPPSELVCVASGTRVNAGMRRPQLQTNCVCV